MSYRLAVFWLCALFVATVALRAEGGTCPEGYYPVNSPGVMGCAPIPGSGNGDSGDRSSVPIPQWQTQWIAIAYGENGFGAAPNMPSKRKAKEAALAQCREMGGVDCHIRMTTDNQCIAVVRGERTAPIVRAPELETAISFATKDCLDAGDTKCEAYYSACSYPIRVR